MCSRQQHARRASQKPPLPSYLLDLPTMEPTRHAAILRGGDIEHSLGSP
jgi:hypothetical protein